MVPIPLNLNFLLESRHMGGGRDCSRQANRKLLRARSPDVGNEVSAGIASALISPNAVWLPSEAACRVAMFVDLDGFDRWPRLMHLNGDVPGHKR